MKKYTWQQLLDELFSRGANLADVAIGSMMDSVGEDTGRWPDWNDEAPEWAVSAALYGGRR